MNYTLNVPYQRVVQIWPKNHMVSIQYIIGSLPPTTYLRSCCAAWCGTALEGATQQANTM